MAVVILDLETYKEKLREAMTMMLKAFEEYEYREGGYPHPDNLVEQFLSDQLKQLQTQEGE